MLVYSDASEYAAGGVLAQARVRGTEKNVKSPKQIIGYYSKKFGKSERNYSVPEKEVYALVNSVEAFGPFVFGYKLLCFFYQRSIFGF